MKIYFPHNVTIERATTTQDKLNQVKQTFTTLVTRRCKITPMSVDDVTDNPELKNIATHQVDMWHYAIRETDRLKFGSRIFNIQEAINVDEEGRYTRLLVKEVK